MTVTTTSTVTLYSDITYSVRETESNSQVNTYADTLDFRLTYNHGTGIPGQSGITNSQVNVYVKTTGIVNTGQSFLLDFQSYNKTTLGQQYTVLFNTLKGIVIENLATGINHKLSIRATGSNAFTAPFNGNTGNIPINPYSTYQYLDPYGSTIDTSNRYLYLHNPSSTGINFQLILVGTNTGITS